MNERFNYQEGFPQVPRKEGARGHLNAVSPDISKNVPVSGAENQESDGTESVEIHHIPEVEYVEKSEGEIKDVYEGMVEEMRMHAEAMRTATEQYMAIQKSLYDISEREARVLDSIEEAVSQRDNLEESGGHDTDVAKSVTALNAMIFDLLQQQKGLVKEATLIGKRHTAAERTILEIDEKMQNLSQKISKLAIGEESQASN